MLGPLAIEAGKVFGTEIIKEGAKQFYNAPHEFLPSPSEKEVATALGVDATDSEKGAYRKGHLSGWSKGFLLGGAVVLVGVVVLAAVLAQKA